MDGGINQNSDGSGTVWGKLPIAGNDNNTVSAIGNLQNSKHGKFYSATGGLALDNANGHSASMTGTHIAGFGQQASVAGKVNLINSNGHDLSANAFATRTFPKDPALPNYNHVGGGVDYSYKQKVGASLGVQHLDIMKKTDYSARGSVNVFTTPKSSLDVFGGVSKSVSPYMPNSSWDKSAGLTYKKRF